MTLSAAVTLAIAYTLAGVNIIKEDQPINEIAGSIESLSTEYLHNVTKVNHATLQSFKDEVVPCIDGLYDQYGNDSDSYELMWVNW